MNSQTIIFFDGVCHLCNGFVDWGVTRDKKRKLKWAPLQGSTATEYLSAQDRQSLETVIVWQNGQVFYRSKAILKILSELGGIWSLIGIFRILPARLLDLFYGIVAKNRYKWFGQREFCRLPTPEERGVLLP